MWVTNRFESFFGMKEVNSKTLQLVKNNYKLLFYAVYIVIIASMLSSL